MAGITDSVFRTICKMHGADIVVSEMISAEGIVHNSKNTNSLLFFTREEQPIGIQLFGSNVKSMVYAAQYIEETKRPDFIDINCGCPAPKVVKKNGGSALLKNPRLFTDILSNMVRAVSLPVTVKIRSGWLKYEWIDTEYAKIAQDCGASAITLHPRSKSMGFSGHSFWERITLIKKIVKIPVIGNGDIATPENGCEMIRQTGCDSIMIGRGALGFPWIFNQIKMKQKGQDIPPLSLKTKINTALLHLKEYFKKNGERRAKNDMKRHIVWYLRGIPNASLIRNKIFRSNSIDDMENLLLQLINNISARNI
jgi:tRNA-dihydrouridine synthase B